jgi:hypothetical protein
MRAVIVFHGRGQGWWAPFLSAGFHHCFISVLDEARGTWIRCDGRAGLPEFRTEAAADFDLAEFYRAAGYAVVALENHQPLPPRTPLMLGTCVGAVKRVLGLRAPFVFTPKQLYRRLFHKQETCMEPVCKPHMLSEYPLGYSRLTYETEDTIAAVEAPGYFGAAAPVLRVRDVIEIWAGIETARPVFRTYAVTRADAAGMVVDIAPVEKLVRRRARASADAESLTGRED